MGLYNWPIENTEMECTHCGAEDSDDYLLRFSSVDGDAQTVELWLCDECVERILSEEDAELISPTIVAVGDNSSDGFVDDYR